MEKMWHDKCKIIYEFRDGRMLVVTKDDYRFDGQQVVVLDSKTAQLALSNKANWKTINGSHVLIGKGSKIIAGMGGKFTHVPVKGKMSTANKKTKVNTNVNGFGGIVQGKDLGDNFKLDDNSTKSAAQQIAEQQGFNVKPKVVSKEEFENAVNAVGFIGYRTWSDFKDENGKTHKAAEFKRAFSNDDDILYNAAGGRAYGGGLYLAAPKIRGAGKTIEAKARQTAMQEAMSYGEKGKSATAEVTLDKSAKIATYSKYVEVVTKFQADINDAVKYNFDVGAYLASKGYDAALFQRPGGDHYVAVYNRSKLIVNGDF